MQVKVTIDSVDIQNDFGVYLEQGGIDAPQLPPTPRQPFFNEWEDSSGRDYDTTSPVVFSPQILEVPFFIIAGNLAEYKTNKDAFLDLVVKNTELNVTFSGIGQSLKLRYVETVSWELLEIALDGQTSARFVLKLENNHRT